MRKRTVSDNFLIDFINLTPDQQRTLLQPLLPNVPLGQVDDPAFQGPLMELVLDIMGKRENTPKIIRFKASLSEVTGREYRYVIHEEPG